MAWPFTTKEDRPLGVPDIPLTTQPTEQKSSGNGYPIFTSSGGSMNRMGTSPEAFAREGYMENAIVYACVRLIASACATVPFQIVSGQDGKVLPKHPMLDLMNRPNGLLSCHEFIEAAVAHLLIFNDVYVTRFPALGITSRKPTSPSELWLLPPQHVSFKAPSVGYGLPLEYKYEASGTPQIFPVNQLTGYCDLLHLHGYNPLSAYRGLSPMQSSAWSIDTHTTALRWNKALLNNAGSPSGALVTGDDANGNPITLAEEQYQRVKAMIDEQFTGAQNAGRPLLLEGGLDWKAMSLSPKDMDFTAGVWAAAMHICAAYRVPPQMLGIPGSQTRANFEQADLTFWQGTILPTLDSVLDKLNKWLAPMFGDPTLRLVPDRNAIPALEPERQLLYTRVNGNQVLTIDERRAMIGFGPLTEAQKEELLVDGTQVPFALMMAQLDAAEETLPGGEGNATLPGSDNPNNEEADPADDEETDPDGTDGQSGGQ